MFSLYLVGFFIAFYVGFRTAMVGPEIAPVQFSRVTSASLAFTLAFVLAATLEAGSLFLSVGGN